MSPKFVDFSYSVVVYVDVVVVTQFQYTRSWWSCVPRRRRRHRSPADVRVLESFDTVGALLLPVFFVLTGLGVDIGGLSVANLVELAAVIVVACAGKFLGAALPARAFGLPWREAGTLGLLMNTRSLTELIILNAGAGLGILDTPMYTMLVIMALFTTALAGPLLPRHRDRSTARRHRWAANDANHRDLLPLEGSAHGSPRR